MNMWRLQTWGSYTGYFEDLKPISTPMDLNVKLSTTQNPSTGAQYAAMRHIPYHKAVGSLIYVMLGTQPDIAFMNTIASKSSGNPTMAHWEAVKRIYRYLIGTEDMWLYGCEERVLVGYVDADGSMTEDHHAISGYMFLIDCRAVSWSSK